MHAQVTACDAGDRGALAAVLAGIERARPLTGVVHAAGVIDDGVIGALTADRIDRVLAPKADAALALDELTAGADLAAFVLFSSSAATFGSPGQGNYAAANAVLDAVAGRRRARGQAAVSIAWGMWEQATGMTAHLGQARTRRRGPVQPIPTGQGLELLDAALAAGPPAVIAVNLDRAWLRDHGAALPPSGTPSPPRPLPGCRHPPPPGPRRRATAPCASSSQACPATASSRSSST